MLGKHIIWSIPTNQIRQINLLLIFVLFIFVLGCILAGDKLVVYSENFENLSSWFFL